MDVIIIELSINFIFYLNQQRKSYECNKILKRLTLANVKDPTVLYKSH